jgi:hypothetical protein
MRRFLARFSEPVSSGHARSSADCTINMDGCGDWPVKTMPTDPVLLRLQGLRDTA